MTAEGAVLWVGALTAMVKEVSPTANYGQIAGALQDMGCIEQLRKGGGRSKSVWRLHHPPTVEIADMISKTRNNPRSTKQQAIEKQINALNTRIQKLEHDLTSVVNFLQVHYKANLDLEEDDGG